MPPPYVINMRVHQHVCVFLYINMDTEEWFVIERPLYPNYSRRAQCDFDYSHMYTIN